MTGPRFAYWERGAWAAFGFAPYWLEREHLAWLELGERVWPFLEGVDR